MSVPLPNELHAEAVNKVIRTRRTVKPKLFDDRPVDESVIRQMLQNANWAPTHGMTEPWRFRVYLGDARKRLADFLATTYKAITPPNEFKPKKFAGMSENAMLAQAVIAVGMKRQEIQKITELDEVMAVACAVQNMHLTAASYGLGGFWSTNVAAVSDQMRDFMQLGLSDRALGLFYVGYPSGEWPDSERGEIGQKVVWERT